MWMRLMRNSHACGRQRLEVIAWMLSTNGHVPLRLPEFDHTHGTRKRAVLPACEDLEVQATAPEATRPHSNFQFS